MPLHARVDQVQKEKMEHRHRLRVESEKAQTEDLTFQPKVNERSKRMAVLRQNDRTGRNSMGLKRSNSFASFQP